jgi:hypothetical protein
MTFYKFTLTGTINTEGIDEAANIIRDCIDTELYRRCNLLSIEGDGESMTETI